VLQVSEDGGRDERHENAITIRKITLIVRNVRSTQVDAANEDVGG